MMDGAGAVSGAGEVTKTLEEVLSLPILVVERVRKAVSEAESFKSECVELGRHSEILADMLRTLRQVVRRIASTYERPVRRIVAEVDKALERSLTLARRCRHAGLLRRVVTMTTGSADFRKTITLLEASAGDLRWLLSIYSADDPDGGVSMPPIATTDPILSYVWSCIAFVQMGRSANALADSAMNLANLALDNDRNKKIIIEEEGVPPLITLLKDGPSSESQIAASIALENLAVDVESVDALLRNFAVPAVVHVLSDSPVSLQTRVAHLVSKMASHDQEAQEEFARANAIRPLVSLLSLDVPLDDPKLNTKNPTSIHSVVQINRDLGKNPNLGSFHSDSGSSRGGSIRDYHYNRNKERENEPPEVILELKIACSEALWKLSRMCVSNSRKITETKGLLCLSKIIEREKGELQLNCLMAVMEIAAAAETDADLRRSGFRINSPASKSVVDQLLSLVLHGSSLALQIPAIKAIGSLARTFPARETRVLNPLVIQLSHWNPEVAAEAARALGKFVSPDNFLCVEHSKAIIEFGAVAPLLRLLRPGEKTQLSALILLCHLLANVPNSENLDRTKALTALESAYRSPTIQDSSIRDLIAKAIFNLELYCVGGHPHRHA
ncbi:hypothetical protein J5N97_007360 [Dioscorea zingiberensis]|uniref:DUF7792 domain-containing protein n=1 Tax=Dioscorea zingiberensis TaxID=325984 RepID=A0A9D5DD35_9LILI|nr:hypothetical protein J5N97_007360 [Dioscorea zingiberensis]